MNAYNDVKQNRCIIGQIGPYVNCLNVSMFANREKSISRNHTLGRLGSKIKIYAKIQGPFPYVWTAGHLRILL